MSKISLQAYKIGEFHFKNTVNGKMQLRFSNKISHNVRYSGNESCEATLRIEVFDKEHPDTISVMVSVQGIFKILQQTEKEFIHVETFKSLFPMARAFIATMSGAGGVPPILIKDFDIESQEIYRMEMGGRHNTDSDGDIPQ